MDVIHLLPDSVANQIAAGEVVQRPSSVVKELMENAVDAGAKSVDVLLIDAGRTSIQVIDDGRGMSQTDARLAFERHATSKIRKAEDLFSLHTMGFRGEALPSIAAVAQVHLTTRTEESELGTSLSIEGSQVVGQEPCSCSVGANFEVKNLFYNVPARRKFLKSNQTELNNVTQEFERIALVNPDVAFSLSHNGNLITRLPISSMRQRVVNVFGRKLNEQLLSIDVDTTLVHLTGFVGKPEAARKKNANQYFFVNGRYMRHPYFHKAVMQAFEHLVPEGEQVPYFLYFQVPPENIDVNIHPTKTEIKFENEAAIWQIVVAAVREALGHFNAVPVMEFDQQDCPEIPVFDIRQHANVQAPRLQINTNYNPFRDTQPQRRADDWEKLYEGLSATPVPMEPASSAPSISDFVQSPDVHSEPMFDRESFPGEERSQEHFQLRGQYILTPVQDGLMFIDQRRAHIRVLYDRYMQQLQQQNTSSQGLLFPEVLQLSPSDAIVLDSMTTDIRSLGFDVVSLGGGSFSINGVPSEMVGSDPVSLLQKMVESAKEKGAEAANDLHHKLALIMARNASIDVGQVLSIAEMESLVSDLFRCENPNLTPTGKTIVVILQQQQIERMFN